MEYGPWWTLLGNNLPGEISSMQGGVPAEFTNWMNSTSTAYSFASLLVMTLPSPRYEFYEEQSFNTIQDNVLAVTDKISTKLGFYPFISMDGQV